VLHLNDAPIAIDTTVQRSASKSNGATRLFWSVGVLAFLALGTLSTLAAPAFPKAGENSLPTNEIPAMSSADLGHALLCLLAAAVLSAVLAFRPRREGGPARAPHVIQAQIMMAIVGALVMLIVGASLARAFAIAGTAGLVRYRAKIDDPKDASVMLACLALGLASGVGLLYLAGAGTAFVVLVLWILEWREPWPDKAFDLKVSAKGPAALKAQVEGLLTQNEIKFELRESTEEHIVYSTQVPHGKRTDRISEAICAMQGSEAVAVVWEEKKAAK
jgi:uncharacterized membrane protein YhiD involved in acid resistance